MNDDQSSDFVHIFFVGQHKIEDHLSVHRKFDDIKTAFFYITNEPTQEWTPEALTNLWEAKKTTDIHAFYLTDKSSDLSYLILGACALDPGDNKPLVYCDPEHPQYERISWICRKCGMWFYGNSEDFVEGLVATVLGIKYARTIAAQIVTLLEGPGGGNG